jgi:shikimate kinase
MHIVLIGYRASGKTTTGRALAGALAMPCVDLDERLAEAMGMSIAEAFSRFGEPWFRAAECIELEKALAQRPGVIALGGGTPCSPASGALLTKARAEGRAKVVYLRATAATLRSRLLTADNAHRPALTGAGHPADEVDDVLRRRAPLYEAAADTAVDVDDLTLEQTVDALIKLVRPAKP